MCKDTEKHKDTHSEFIMLDMRLKVSQGEDGHEQRG
jgi:hypothetical protein